MPVALSSTTQHNIPFFGIHILEKAKFKRVGLFWKILIWVEIFISLLLWSPSTTQHNFSFFEILIFENLCSENIFPSSKSLIILENIYLSRNWYKLFAVLAELNSAQLSIFRNSYIGKYLFKKYFPVQKSYIILENNNLSGNCLKSLLLWSPSSTFFFSKFSSLKIFVQKILPSSKKFDYFGKYEYDGNCLKSLLLWSPSTNQHNFLFFEILIFENLCSKNISKFKKVWLY